jgi:glycosyltransferase involved in cell wall biosynthesis
MVAPLVQGVSVQFKSRLSIRFDMKISMILCTRNRAEQLRGCLAKMAEVEPSRRDVEFVIVNNGSTDNTSEVVAAFAKSAPFDVRLCEAPQPGLARARNAGLAASTGELIFFTDDDCYLEDGFFTKFERAVQASGLEYGGGQVLLYSPDDDERVANLKVTELSLVPAHTPVVPAGVIQGANMFYFRKVFDAAGPFDSNLGAGTPFPCEDIEMVARASRHGFTGGQVPGFTVLHHHTRLRGSPEANKTILEYDRGRGAYYAGLLTAGVAEAWPSWWSQTYVQGHGSDREKIERLCRELKGAAEYLEFMLASPDFMPAPMKSIGIKEEASALFQKIKRRVLPN